MYHFQPLITNTSPCYTSTAFCAPMASYPVTYLVNQPVITSSVTFEARPLFSSSGMATDTGEAKLASTEIPIYGYAPIGSIRLQPIEIKLGTLNIGASSTNQYEGKKLSESSSTREQSIKTSEDILIDRKESNETENKIIVEDEKQSDDGDEVVVKKEVIHHHHHVHVPEISREDLEERIRRIRQELNLPDTSVQEELYKDHLNHHYRDNQSTTKWVSNRSVEDGRSRSKSAERWVRSKSKSPGRVTSAKPAWRPTGSNDYTSTYLRRADMILSAEKKKDLSETRSKTSIGTFTEKSDNPSNTQYYKYYYVEKAPKIEPYYTYTTPAKTTIRTTIEAPVSNKKEYHYEPYHLPLITSNQPNNLKYAYYEPARTTTTYVCKNVGAGGKSVEYPTAGYHYQPVYRTNSYSNISFD